MKTSVILILVIASIMVMEMAPEVEAAHIEIEWSSIMGDNNEGFNPVGDHDEDQEPNGDNNVEVFKIVESHESQISYHNYGDFKKSKYGGCNKNGCCNCSKQAGSGTCAVTDNYCLRGCKYMSTSYCTVHSSEKMC